MSSLWIGSDGQLVIDCPYEERELVKNAGGKWDSTLRRWVLAFTPDAVEAMMDAFPDLQISKEVETELVERIEREKKLAKIKEMSETNTEVRLKVAGLKGSLYNYQRLGVMFAKANGTGVLVADEMGLGKSLQAIAYALSLKNQGLIKEALIVVPPSLKYNWMMEIQKWTDEKFVVVDGSPENRLVQWNNKDAFFYIVNYELLLEDLFGGKSYKAKPNETDAERLKRFEKTAKSKNRAQRLASVRERVWGLIALDEAHFIKSSNSARTRNVKQLKGKYRVALTGTPLDGRLEELHSVMDFVCPGLLGSKTRFMQRHAETDIWGKVIKYRKVSEVRRKISPYFIRRLKADVLKDLPDKVYSNRIVELTKAEMDIYNELADRGHDATEDAAAMTAIIRCKQFCDSPGLLADALEKEGNTEVDLLKQLRALPTSKLEVFKEVLREVIDNGHKALVFSQYATMVKILMREFDEMGVKYLCIWGDTPKKDRAEYQEKFNTDKSIDLMVGTAAMGTGLNFTAADSVLNYDDEWSPSLMDQRSDRAHRIGQKNTVTVVNFICKDTIEERVRGILYSKSKITAHALGDEVDDFMLQRMGAKEAAKLL